jgi:hypothetical protein
MSHQTSQEVPKYMGSKWEPVKSLGSVTPSERLTLQPFGMSRLIVHRTHMYASLRGQMVLRMCKLALSMRHSQIMGTSLGSVWEAPEMGTSHAGFGKSWEVLGRITFWQC